MSVADLYDAALVLTNPSGMMVKPQGDEIERMRIQVHRQRGEIKQLQRAGIPTASAEAARSDVEQHRSALRGARPAEKGTARPVQRESSGRASVVTMREPLQWYDHNADNPPRIKARAEVRQLAPREGWCYQHVQAIIVAIDQYAETALGNREFFLNRPYGIGGGMKDNIP